MARTKKADKKTVGKPDEGLLEYRLKERVGTHRTRAGVKLKAGDTIFVSDVSELGAAADKFELASGTVKKQEDVPAVAGLRRKHKSFGNYYITEEGNEEPLHEGTMYKAAAVAIVEGGREALDAWIAEQSED